MIRNVVIAVESLLMSDKALPLDNPLNGLTSSACKSDAWEEFRNLSDAAIDSIAFPLSSQSLWESVYTTPFSRAAMLADELFASNYMQLHALGCPSGFLVATIFRLIPFALSDREGWVERLLNVINYLLPKVGFEEFGVFKYLNLLRQMHDRLASNYTMAEQVTISQLIAKAVHAMGPISHVLITIEEINSCSITHHSGGSFPTLIIGSWCEGQNIFCVPTFFPLKTQLKYLAIRAVLAAGKSFAYLERETFCFENLNFHTWGAPFIFIPRHLHVDSLFPWALIGSGSSATLITAMLDWLDRNPFPVEHQALETLLRHEPSTVYIQQYSDGIRTSYLRENPIWEVDLVVLDPNKFASAEGFRGASQDPEMSFGFGPDEIEKYRRIVKSDWSSSHKIYTLNYAHNCCYNAQILNSQTAIQFGADRVFQLNISSVPDSFIHAHQSVFSENKGAGFWLWKPKLILDTLTTLTLGDVLVYLDAGNHFVGELKKFASSALSLSDVAAPMLSCCIESDWTKADTFSALGAEEGAIAESPQIGAFLILLRKSDISVKFVAEWLQYCERAHLLTDTQSVRPNRPTFIKHTHDQSIFSVLFKKFAFQSFPLRDAHRLANLTKWRN